MRRAAYTVCVTPSTNAVLVAVKLFTAYVLFAHARGAQRLLHCQDHRRRSNHVIDRCLESASGAADQIGVDEAGLPAPRTGGLAHFRHRGDQLEIAVLPLELLELTEKRGVFRAAVRIEKH